MEIKLPIKFHANYKVIVRDETGEKAARCNRVLVREFTPAEKERFFGNLDESERPTHQVTFHDYGCKRSAEGRIIENTPEKLTIEIRGGKQYEFSLLRPGEERALTGAC